MALPIRRVAVDFLRRCEIIEFGSLRVRTPEGKVHDFGAGEPHAEMRIIDWAAVTAAGPGDARLSRTYTHGLWDTPSIEELATVLLYNTRRLDENADTGFWRAVKRGARGRKMPVRPTRADRALEAVGNEFYMLWLDPGMSYSSALFTADDPDLHRAQNRKIDRILDMLGPSERILDLGCGWGSFAERAADRGHHVSGLTTSLHQKGYADARLDGRAEIRLEDYRKTEGSFASIVAIEVACNEGTQGAATLFSAIKRHLTESGTAVAQIAIAPGQDRSLPAWHPGVPQHCFDAGIPAGTGVAALFAEAARAGLTARNAVARGKHSAATWREWGKRLDAQRDRIAHMGFSPDLIRHWRFRFGMRAAANATGHADVVQMTLSHA